MKQKRHTILSCSLSRLFSLSIMLIVLGLTCRNARGEAEFRLEHAGTGTYLINGAGLEKIAALDFVITYDTGTALNPRVSKGAFVPADASFFANTAIPGELRVMLVRGKEIAGSGTLAIITFEKTGISEPGILSFKSNPISVTAAPLDAQTLTASIPVVPVVALPDPPPVVPDIVPPVVTPVLQPVTSPLVPPVTQETVLPAVQPSTPPATSETVPPVASAVVPVSPPPSSPETVPLAVSPVAPPVAAAVIPVSLSPATPEVVLPVAPPANPPVLPVVVPVSPLPSTRQTVPPVVSPVASPVAPVVVSPPATPANPVALPTTAVVTRTVTLGSVTMPGNGNETERVRRDKNDLQPVVPVITEPLPPADFSPTHVESSPKSQTLPLKNLVYPSVLYRMKVYGGERTPSELMGLFKPVADQNVSQEPSVAITDGEGAVTLRVNLLSMTKDIPNFSFRNARMVSLEQSDGGSWVVTLVPHKNTFEARLVVSFEGGTLVYPLIVAPLIDPALLALNGSLEDAFALFLKQSGAAFDPRFDLNGDGKFDYVDDYIFTANYLAARQKVLQKMSKDTKKK